MAIVRSPSSLLNYSWQSPSLREDTNGTKTILRGGEVYLQNRMCRNGYSFQDCGLRVCDAGAVIERYQGFGEPADFIFKAERTLKVEARYFSRTSVLNYQTDGVTL